MNSDENKKLQYKIVSFLSLLTGGAVAGNIYRGLYEVAAQNRGEMFQLVLPMVIIDIVIIGIGIYTLRRV